MPDRRSYEIVPRLKNVTRLFALTGMAMHSAAGVPTRCRGLL